MRHFRWRITGLVLDVVIGLRLAEQEAGTEIKALPTKPDKPGDERPRPASL